MNNCLNCKKLIENILGQFCSEKCSEEWQEKNQECSQCKRQLDLLEEEYTVNNSQQVLCQRCGHNGHI